MKSNKHPSFSACFLRKAGLTWLALAAPLAHAQTVWTGPATNYTQPAAFNPALPASSQLANVDQITADVWFTRGGNHPAFNAAPPYNETSYNGSTSPENTEWAFGDITGYADLTFDTWANVIGGEQGGDLSLTLPNNPLVLHIISDDIYLSVEFSSWTHQGAGFSYTRSTPNAVAPPPTPTVSITNPTNGATFTAPASVSITADAEVSSGSVTNVEFFAGTVSLGSATAFPFTITASSLPAGGYALTAVATAAGVSATSAAVNITVIPPAPSVTLTNPVAGTVFSAPATLKLGATAAVSSGTVTNVAFFAGATPLGSAQTSPFKTTSSSLAAGNYSLTAVATAAGISTTSAVVNISVVAPVAVSNSVPAVAAGHFAFSYSANVGLVYVVQKSADLVHWSPVSTNVASSNPAHFADASTVGAAGYYRVVLQPNP